jgi:hypothetical protein
MGMTPRRAYTNTHMQAGLYHGFSRFLPTVTKTRNLAKATVTVTLVAHNLKSETPWRPEKP